MVTKNYNNVPMTGLYYAEYATLLAHLSDQLATKMQRVSGHGISFDECYKSAVDVLTSEFVETKTALEWLADAGKRFGVDTSDCVGV